MAAAQKPLHRTIFEAASHVPAWREIPSWALISANDRMIHPEAQRRMARRARAKTREVPCGHASLVARPAETADLILAATASVCASGVSA